MQKNSINKNFIIKILQGTLIGVGAVLPGISGGVLCVIFGIYKTIMEFLAAPFQSLKTHLPKLLPVFLGCVIGFLGIANILAVILENYPSQSVCFFVGLIGGMLPSLYREAGEQGRSKASFASMFISMAIIFGVLIGLRVMSFEVTPSYMWYVFCGFALALSVIAPGMSFSTLLMPLGLYEPFISGIGSLDFTVLIPGGVGGLLTLILLSQGVNLLFEKYYSVTFHGIIGIVIAATIMIIPFYSFTVSVISCIINTMCIVVGGICSYFMDGFNRKVEIK